MSSQSTWAQDLVNKLIMRMVLVQRHAAYRVAQKGGHEVAQACASVAAIETFLEGGSSANAIAAGITMGMNINARVNTINYLKVKSCQ